MALQSGVNAELPEVVDELLSCLPTYEGVNLERKFASEISGYSSVWAWIKARATAKDFSGLHVKDYVQWTSGVVQGLRMKLVDIK